MNGAFELLMAVGVIGAVDVLWFHIWRLRLYARPHSAGEQLTHLVRHVLFSALAAMFVLGAPREWILGVLALDLLNSLLDVALEPRSRAPVGGISGREAALHALATFMLGAVFALTLTASEGWSPTPLQLVRGAITAVLAAALFAIELALTVGARLRQSSRAS